MNGSRTVEPLLTLLALRYRLLWAHARSGQGRLVLVAVGVLVLALVLVLAGLGGLGAAAASIRAGRSDLVATVVLVGVFLNATLAAIFLGIGVHPAFDDAALRRYPVSRRVRFAARHVIGMLEPLWLIVLALVVGMSVGLSGFAPMSLAVVFPAAILFVVVTYLTARVVTGVIEWILSKPGGPLVITVIGVTAMMMVPLVPALAVRASTRAPALLALFQPAPPLAAARLITGSGVPAAIAGLTLIAWGAGLLVALGLVERLSRGARSAPSGSAIWRHPVDRIAMIFGPALSPLAGKILRYYVRSPQVRYNYPLVLPVLALMAGRADDSGFLYVLGALPAAAFLATGTLSMNLFGFDGHGFRRYFLLPVRAADVLRTAALVSLLPGALLVPIALVSWMVFVPQSTSVRTIAMLASAGFGGLLFFHALATWTAVLAPRAIPFDAMFGNKLSPAANGLFIAAMAAFFGLPMLLTGIGLDAVLARWWVAPLFLAAAAGLYLVTLRAGANVLFARREQMLAVIEG